MHQADSASVFVLHSGDSVGEKHGLTSYSSKRGRDLYALFDTCDRNAIVWLEEFVLTTEFCQLFMMRRMPVVP